MPLKESHMLHYTPDTLGGNPLRVIDWEVSQPEGLATRDVRKRHGPDFVPSGNIHYALIHI
jgi:hypothetical protein